MDWRNEKLLELCNELFDRLTLIKGYLKLNTERKNIDYTITILNEVNQIERLTREIIDSIKEIPPISRSSDSHS